MMPAKLIASNQKETVIEIRIVHSNSMLNGEEAIQDALNEAGKIASGELLTRFDTDGSPIKVGAVKLTSKGLFPKRYQTPHGEIEISRHVYQGTKGGFTYCPLDANARTIHSATPKLAKQIAHKYSKLSVDEVKTDFESNHKRKLSRGYIQDVSDAVGSIALAKEEHWSYRSPIQLKL